MDDPVRISVAVQDGDQVRQFKVEEATFEAAVVALMRMLTQRPVAIVGTAT